MPLITLALLLAVIGLYASAICEKWASPKVCKIVGVTFFTLAFSAYIVTILTI